MLATQLLQKKPDPYPKEEEEEEEEEEEAPGGYPARGHPTNKAGSDRDEPQA